MNDKLAAHYVGKVAIITGAASGIGLELARHLIRCGAIVVMTDIDPCIEEIAAKIGSLTPRHHSYQERPAVTGYRCDVTDSAALTQLADITMQRYGRIDLLFCSAGIAAGGAVEELTLNDWRQVIEVNLMGVIHAIRAVYPLMLKQRSGQIVAIASLAGVVPLPLGAPYAASKHAVVGLMGSLWAEGRSHGVQTTVVALGHVATKFALRALLRNVHRDLLLRALPPSISVERAVRGILRAVARGQSEVTLPWHARLVAGLQRLSPTLVRLGLRWRLRDYRRHESRLTAGKARDS